MRDEKRGVSSLCNNISLFNSHSFPPVFLSLSSDAMLDKSSSLLPHGMPYGIELVKCPARVPAALPGSFNKGVIYRQHGGLTAFSDSHVSVSERSHVQGRGIR